MQLSCQPDFMYDHHSRHVLLLLFAVCLAYCLLMGVQICQNLLKALDINPAIQDQLGNTCVHNMLRWGHEGDQASRQYLKVLRKLVVLSPGVGDITNKSGDTPLHLACKNAFTDAVALLLMANADANSRTKYERCCCNDSNLVTSKTGMETHAFTSPR